MVQVMLTLGTTVGHWRAGGGWAVCCASQAFVPCLVRALRTLSGSVWLVLVPAGRVGLWLLGLSAHTRQAKIPRRSSPPALSPGRSLPAPCPPTEASGHFGRPMVSCDLLMIPVCVGWARQGHCRHPDNMRRLVMAHLGTPTYCGSHIECSSHWYFLLASEACHVSTWPHGLHG